MGQRIQGILTVGWLRNVLRSAIKIDRAFFCRPSGVIRFDLAQHGILADELVRNTELALHTWFLCLYDFRHSCHFKHDFYLRSIINFAKLLSCELFSYYLRFSSLSRSSWECEPQISEILSRHQFRCEDHRVPRIVLHLARLLTPSKAKADLIQPRCHLGLQSITLKTAFIVSRKMYNTISAAAWFCLSQDSRDLWSIEAIASNEKCTMVLASYFIQWLKIIFHLS